MRRGFSLVELIVVIAVTAIISSVLIVYNRAAREQIALSVESVKIAQAIGRARSLAVTTALQSTDTCGYGVAFDYASQTYSFVRYDDAVTCTNIAAGPVPFVQPPIEVYPLPQNVQFTIGPDRLAAIVFIPPEPTAYLFDENGDVAGTPKDILLESVGGETATITVEYGGLISL